MYVEGYGALFLLGVRFPLVHRREKVEETAAKEEPSSDWAVAWEEYHQGERNSIGPADRARVDRREPDSEATGSRPKNTMLTMVEDLKTGCSKHSRTRRTSAREARTNS